MRLFLLLLCPVVAHTKLNLKESKLIIIVMLIISFIILVVLFSMNAIKKINLFIFFHSQRSNFERVFLFVCCY